MIVTEHYKARSDGVVLVRTYSDTGRYIARDGVEYAEAIDPAELGRTYTESDREIVAPNDEVPAETALAELREVLGVEA